jgi:para-aminobenzoate synthetase component 1
MVSPLVHEITYLDPLLVFSVFAQQDGALFLDSAQLREGAARYSFIAVNPFQTLLSKDAVVRLNDQIFHDDPFTVLEKQLALFPIVFHAELPPFQGGIAGYFGFDLCHHLEILPFSPYDDMQFPDLAVGFYDLVIGFDLLLQRAWIFSSGYPLHESPSRLQRAEARCQWLLKKLPLYPPLLSHSSVQCLPEEIQANHTTTSYQQGVKQVIDYILAGDIFEANLSQRFSAVLPENLSAFQLYCRLRLSVFWRYDISVSFAGAIFAAHTE